MSLNLVFLSGLSLDLFLALCLDPCEVASARAFYSSRSGSYNESRGPTSGLGACQTLWCMAQRLGVAYDVLHDVSSVESSCLITLLH
jgi:hypothetical protein